MSAALRPPESAGLGRGVLFALLAHAALVVALSAGVSWRSRTTPAFEAELWASVPQVAAPPEETPPPPTARKPDPEPPKAEAPQQRDADIVVARDKARKEREEAERRKQAELDAKAEKERKDKLEKDKKDKAERAAKEAKEAKLAEAKLEAKREALRQEQLRRLQGLAGATGNPNSTGTAQQNAAPSSGYAGRIKAHIRPLIIFNAEGNENPEMEVRVTLWPDGRIVSVTKLRGSPNPDWDRAVLRGIDKAERLPRDIDGRVPAYIDLVMRPKE